MNGICIAKLVTEFRRVNGLSQGEFGRLIGVSANAVSKWEREICYPDVTFLPQLAEIIGVEVNDLFEK